jgi:hypothetical protein
LHVSDPRLRLHRRRLAHPLSGRRDARARRCVGAPGTDPYFPASAGVLTIEDAIRLTLEPGPYANYQSIHADGTLLDGGALHVAAAGAEVPAFRVDLSAPAVIVVDEPRWPDDGTRLTIARDQPLPIEWSGAAGSQVSIELSGGGVSVQREVDSGVGAVTVPVEVLSALPVGAGSVSARATTRATVSSGAFEISVIATSGALRPDGTRGGGTITIE